MKYSQIEISLPPPARRPLVELSEPVGVCPDSLPWLGAGPSLRFGMLP